MASATEHDPLALGAIDGVAVEQWWNDFVAARIAADQRVPQAAPAFQFGDTAEMADRLLALVVDGPKRATASCRLDYAADGSDLPEVGEAAVVCDGRGRPAALVETTEVRIGRLGSVDEAFAWDEGEGDRTLADWLRMHRNFFERSLGPVWERWGDDLPVVFERFALVPFQQRSM